jgi:predicted RNA-binding protein
MTIFLLKQLSRITFFLRKQTIKEVVKGTPTDITFVVSSLGFFSSRIYRDIHPGRRTQ